MSGAIKFLIAAVVLYAGYALWQKHNDRAEAAALAAITDDRGFIELTPPNGGKRESVIIVAAQNCPHEAAQRADALAREMAERNIRYVRRRRSFSRRRLISTRRMSRATTAS